MEAKGFVHKYGDNVDTDVIIPARYLNIADKQELATHCMEDIDRGFVQAVKPGDVMVGGLNFGCGSSREHAPMVIKESGIEAGDEVQVDFDTGVITDVTKGETFQAEPFPAFIKEIIQAGGLMASIKARAKEA